MNVKYIYFSHFSIVYVWMNDVKNNQSHQLVSSPWQSWLLSYKSSSLSQVCCIWPPDTPSTSESRLLLILSFSILHPCGLLCNFLDINHTPGKIQKIEQEFSDYEVMKQELHALT